MKDQKIKDYVMTFESRGTTPLFEDLISNSYMPDGSLSIYKDGTIQAFLSKEAIDKMQKMGENSTPQQTQEIIDKLWGLIEQMKKEVVEFETRDEFTLDKANHMLGLLKELSSTYEYFDFSNWDTAYEKSKDNPEAAENIKLIGDFKNKIRIELGPVYFEANGYMGTLLKGVAAKSEVTPDDMRWYTVKELLNLIEHGEQINRERIDSRKRVFVTQRDFDGKTYFLEDLQAEDFIKNFGEKDKEADVNILQGKTAHSTGQKVQGRVRIITMNYGDTLLVEKAMAEMEHGEVLVSQTTSPDLMKALQKASAIITDVGGLLSHAAITARELNTPCIVGTEVATTVLKNGDTVEVDADKGTVKILK